MADAVRAGRAKTASGILQYCYQMRGITEQPLIDTYSLGNILDHDQPLLDAMVDKGVLAPHGNYSGLDARNYNTFYFKRPYFDRFFATVVTWSMMKD